MAVITKQENIYTYTFDIFPVDDSERIKCKNFTFYTFVGNNAPRLRNNAHREIMTRILYEHTCTCANVVTTNPWKHCYATTKGLNNSILENALEALSIHT